MRGKWLKLLSMACVISVAVMGTLGAAGRVYTAATTLSPPKNKLPVIIIDAGHGGLPNTIDWSKTAVKIQ